jgi:hypothetical protein
MTIMIVMIASIETTAFIVLAMILTTAMPASTASSSEIE